MNNLINLLYVCLVASSWLKTESFAETFNGWYSSSVETAGETAQQEFSEVGLEPTRLMLVPTSQVLNKNQYVVSFHEFSYGLENDIQVFFSVPWYPSAGRLNLGAKFGLREDLVFALGISFDNEFRLINSLGAYGVRIFKASYESSVYGLLGLRVGSDYGIDVGLGIDKLTTDHLKLMAEIVPNLLSINNKGNFDLDINLGLRYMWPHFMPLKIDLGLNLEKLIGNNMIPVPYVDISYSSEIR